MALDLEIPEENMTEFIKEFTRLRNCYTCRRDHPERSLSGHCSKCTPQKVISDFKKFIKAIYKGIINKGRSQMIQSGQDETTLEFLITLKASKKDLNKWLNNDTFKVKYLDRKE